MTYTGSTYTRALEEWRGIARDYAVKLALENDGLVSVNDLFDSITDNDIRFFAPPAGEDVYKIGHALCAVFRCEPMFKDTGNEIPSINPLSRGRKVKVWEYVPEYDRSGIDPLKTRTWD